MQLDDTARGKFPSPQQDCSSGRATHGAMDLTPGFHHGYSERASYLCSVLARMHALPVCDYLFPLFSSLSESGLGKNAWQKCHMT